MNICLFPGQGTKTFHFEKNAEIYFNQVTEILNINKNNILNNDYPFKFQLLSLIYNISNFDKLKQVDSAFYNNIDILIGYSLGEYTSLVCSECISFKECVKLIKKRSELMHKCGIDTKTCLITILGITEKYIKIIFKDIHYYISIYLSKEGFVLSVNKNDVDIINSKINTFKKLHKIYFKLLDVDGGFHSPFMEESSSPFKEYLNTVDFHNPKIKTISNYDGLIYSNVPELKQKLTYHLTSPIRWDNIIKNNLNNINKIYEIGGNKLKRTLMLNNIDITNYNHIG